MIILKANRKIVKNNYLSKVMGLVIAIVLKLHYKMTQNHTNRIVLFTNFAYFGRIDTFYVIVVCSI